MDCTTSPSYSNRLLDSLPEEDRKRFLADCEIVDLAFGRKLAEPGETISYAFFPIDCLVSLIATLESGGRLEVSMAGNEGMVGFPLMLGAEKSSLQAVVQGAGAALRMSSACFQDHLERSPALERLMKRYLNVLMSQISQSAACAHYHSLEARTARWLLMTHDRTRGDELRITHEFLSGMLGVRRAGVTLAAKALQRRGLIDYQRGRITVHDRPGLEAASCRCYATDRKTYGQMIERLA
ncbi:Crp/Fnr family transcriptional regulator [Halomonas daqiaonensis]|uniref:cAMP-binding domain of CRP or a regulatory subunit of cAMP-dependent protein kinases n=1 Tax=Halomonas daqiaonensis TaxID=650850 RepID=A0A1H7QX36_9GAMM|nr:Crp/Fnr family transcriptional regulator [Halomonas daqiaonensis]SEL52288.1 cAMP-binding domain of CRP or a regulatory subunit of cAMP-dependent protein kinases [Halomonas daqiaonensis]